MKILIKNKEKKKKNMHKHENFTVYFIKIQYYLIKNVICKTSDYSMHAAKFFRQLKNYFFPFLLLWENIKIPF